MPLRLALAVLAALLVTVPDASAEPRVATTSEGVRIVLDGATATVRLPAGVRTGSVLNVECGAGRTRLRGRRRTGVRSGVLVRVRLPQALPRAEWCAYSAARGTDARDLSGAGDLEPRVSAPPAPVVKGPGVRSGSSEDVIGSALSGTGTATFDLAGSALTVRLPAGFVRSTVVALACFPFAVEHPAATAFARVAVRRGQREVTAVLVGGDLGSVAGCVLEESGDGGDLVGVDLAAPPGPLLTLGLITKDMQPRLREGAALVFDLRAYATRRPAVGDIVAFRAPASAFDFEAQRCAVPRGPTERELCVKATGDVADEPVRTVLRVAGVGGDRIAFRGGRVVRNGVLEQRRRLGRCPDGRGCTFRRAVTVPPGHVFLAGDDRGRAVDSRWFGAIPERQVVGRYVRPYRPAQR